MVNPVAPAANFFLGFFQALPLPVRALAIVACAFFIILAIVKVVRK